MGRRRRLVHCRIVSALFPAHTSRSMAAVTFSYNDRQTFHLLNSSSDKIVSVGNSHMGKMGLTIWSTSLSHTEVHRIPDKDK